MFSKSVQIYISQWLTRATGVVYILLLIFLIAPYLKERRKGLFFPTLPKMPDCKIQSILKLKLGDRISMKAIAL